MAPEVEHRVYGLVGLARHLGGDADVADAQRRAVDTSRASSSRCTPIRVRASVSSVRGIR